MNNLHTLTVPFSAIRATDLPLVGGKGANLGELTNVGFPIPQGFCVTTMAFKQFMDGYPDQETLYEKLETVANDLETARKVGEWVRNTLLTVPIPSSIADSVRQAWQEVGTDKAYAVRSSATAEDLPDASFAGQQDTYLNVIGEDALLEAVRKCWVSLFTDRAILYRIQNNFPHQDVQLSVVVQEMVMSETSGILFTADPLTGHRHTATIDASFGLGEALVGGLVSPDAYRVDKRDMTIIEKEIANKQIAIYPEKEGGVRQVDLTTDQQNQTVLTDPQIMALTDLGKRVEAHYGTPQDIEWAMVGEALYLLQARPITSLYPIENLKSPDGSLHVYLSIGSQQMMTNVMSPLGMSGMATVLPFGKAGDASESSLLRASGGRLFGDITQGLRHPVLGRIIPAVFEQFDALAPEMIRLATQRPEFQRPNQLRLNWSAIRFGAGMLRKVFASLWWRDLTGFAAQANDVIAESIKQRKQKIEKATTPEEKITAVIESIRTIFEGPIIWIPTLVAGVIATRLIQRVGKGRVDAETLESFDLALPGNVVTEMNLAIGDLADLARKSPQLVAMFSDLREDSAVFLAEGKTLPDSEPFFKAWERFLDQYGSRASAEIDIQAPRWYEEPLPLLQVVASFLQKETGSHRIQHKALENKREQAVATMISTAESSFLGFIRVRLLKRLLHVAHNGAVLREHHKFTFIEMLRVAKETVKECAEQLVTENKLQKPDDVFYLSWPELLDVASGKQSDVGALIEKRRAELEQFAHITPGTVITSDGETPAVKYQVDDAPDGALIGNPVSSGMVEGIARVIHDPHTETLNPGDILVAPFTDPGWTPLFINAGGLVMEVGGAMTHGSVVAREYGIPAIVGVSNATQTIKTGQMIRVDGNRGVIEVL